MAERRVLHLNQWRRTISVESPLLSPVASQPIRAAPGAQISM